MVFKKLIVLSIIILLSWEANAISLGWQKLSFSLPDSDIRCLALDPKWPTLIYMGTSKAVYRVDTHTQKIETLFNLSGENKGVNFIYIDPENPRYILAVTNDGLYESGNESTNFKRIYFSSDKEENQCLTVLRHGPLLFLGTKKGVLVKDQSETNWHKLVSTLSNDPIIHSAQDESFIYFATDQAIFGLDKSTKQVKEIFSVGTSRELDAEESFDTTQGSDTPQAAFQIKALVTTMDPPQIWVATAQGIYLSNDQGQKWQRIPSDTLPLEAITSLVILPQYIDTNNLENLTPGATAGDQIKTPFLLAATTRGSFGYLEKKWVSFYQGMETNDIRYLIKSSDDQIYAATDSGLFYLDIKKAFSGDGVQANLAEGKSPSLHEISQMFYHEPSIHDIHCWAIDYAEVDPEKIKDWRSLARKRAILPSLSAGLNRADADLLHWDSGRDPDQLLRGDDYLDWDVGLSWDLADLVWNPDQTSIDSRSKSMVELREDILDQITRLYFERRRAQVELIQLASLDPQMRLDKEMRLEELTALLDAYTGGKFSRQIEENLKRMDEEKNIEGKR